MVPGRRIRVEGAFTATLSTNPDPVELMLRTGATHYCLAFGGKAKFQASKRFTATTSPAPASCPAPVDWSSYGFDLTQTRFNPVEGLINAATVSQLDVQWFFSTGSGNATLPMGTASTAATRGPIQREAQKDSPTRVTRRADA